MLCCCSRRIPFSGRRPDCIHDFIASGWSKRKRPVQVYIQNWSKKYHNRRWFLSGLKMQKSVSIAHEKIFLLFFVKKSMRDVLVILITISLFLFATFLGGRHQHQKSCTMLTEIFFFIHKFVMRTLLWDSFVLKHEPHQTTSGQLVKFFINIHYFTHKSTTMSLY